MSAPKRYAVVAVILIWLFGNIPAWMLMPHYTSHDGGRESYAIWWSVSPLFLVCAAAFALLLGPMFADFGRWVVHGSVDGPPKDTEAERAARIAKLERELGIGQED